MSDWLNRLKENIEKLRDSDLAKERRISDCQYFLHERMHKLNDGSKHWTAGNWRDLIKEYGEKIATAFRDGLLIYWGNYKPISRSEKDEGNQTSYSVIFGLTGLEIESRETPNWPNGLDEKDAELACRYAFWELNGFPVWFPKLYKNFPAIVSSIIIEEIRWELRTENPTKEKYYVINKVSWDGQWLWDNLAVDLLQKLWKEPVSLQNLSNMLKIAQGSSIIADKEIAEIAETPSRKCTMFSFPNHMAYWFATWIGTDPKPAIHSLSNHLLETNDQDTAKTLAMNVIVNLVGDRIAGSSAREVLKTPEHLKKLYLLMHKYIKVEEDINRSGGSVYSPKLRDNAQEARDGLFSILKDIPGKESFLALVEPSKTHPVESYRSWMMCQAKERAEMDADISAWTVEQFLEFNRSLESILTSQEDMVDIKPSFCGVGLNLNALWRLY